METRPRGFLILVARLGPSTPCGGMDEKGSSKARKVRAAGRQQVSVEVSPNVVVPRHMLRSSTERANGTRSTVGRALGPSQVVNTPSLNARAPLLTLKQLAVALSVPERTAYRIAHR